jgi:hypothetical protein
MADSGVLSPSQKRAISALLTSRNIRAAAQTAKVAERSLARWLADSAFQGALHQAESEALGETVRRMAHVAGLAVDALEATLTDKGTQPGVKVQAANVVLAKLADLKELTELEQRITAIEERFGGKKP